MPVFGITKIVPKKQEDLAGFDLVSLTFTEAYAELRRVVPLGDLRIHLSAEAHSAAEAGVIFENESTSALREG